MSFTWTPQQVAIFETVAQRNPMHELIKINAVAGASKTTTLVEIAKRFKEKYPDKSFRYLVFGAANSAEAKLAFGYNAICSTLHALAYHSVVKQYKLKTPVKSFISWRDIPKSLNIPYNSIETATDIVYEFCDSPMLTFDAFAHSTDYRPDDINYARSLLSAMYKGELNTTHAFYLKLYHIGIMEGTIVPATEDILAIDEAGDLTQITLDIFDKYPAKQKIMVGDEHQAIFSFMGCINGFDYYRNKGISLELTQSFRVSSTLATGIQKFCNSTFSPSMVFEGMNYKNPQPKTEAYIARTNSDLLYKMVQLNNQGIPYNLTSKAKVKQMFKYPLFLILAKPGKKQFDSELKVLQRDIDTWETMRLKDPSFQMSKSAYLLEHNKDNPALAGAFALLAKFGPKDILSAYNAAELHKNTASNLTLVTGHSSKGLTFDIVTLDDSMNKAIDDVMSKFSLSPGYVPTEDEVAELRLYYVACSRCRYVLNNAKYIKEN